MGENRLLPNMQGRVFLADDTGSQKKTQTHVAIIACGALAHEIIQLIRINDFQHLQLFCLPAKLHNRPQLIVPALREKVTQLKNAGYQKILIGYGDCGTGGTLDAFLREEKLTRIAGNHCYAFFSGLNNFEQMMEQELGTFFLTDYLAKFFDTLIMHGMGLDKNPELRDMYFGNYKKLVYLAQLNDEKLDQEAMRAADILQLEYHRVQTGYGLLGDFVAEAGLET